MFKWLAQNLYTVAEVEKMLYFCVCVMGATALNAFMQNHEKLTLKEMHSACENDSPEKITRRLSQSFGYICTYHKHTLI